jgi:hypothetical protein
MAATINKACGVANGEGQGFGWWAREPATWAKEKDREIKKEKKHLGKRGIRENREEKRKRRHMKKEISPYIT